MSCPGAVPPAAPLTLVVYDVAGVEPAELRPGYANFEIADPPLKLVLFEHPDAAAHPLNHLGVEVTTTAEVAHAAQRFRAAGLHHTTSDADRCCHAVQDKVWVDAPDAPLNGWEFSTVLANDLDQTEAGPSTCCGGPASTPTGCWATADEPPRGHHERPPRRGAGHRSPAGCTTRSVDDGAVRRPTARSRRSPPFAGARHAP
jgi:hypothetical protein